MSEIAANDFKRGFEFNDGAGIVRVMQVADGYAMCRRPGCTPFVRKISVIVEDMAEQQMFGEPATLGQQRSTS